MTIKPSTSRPGSRRHMPRARSQSMAKIRGTTTSVCAFTRVAKPKISPAPISCQRLVRAITAQQPASSSMV
ncbi:hypothetical protein D3C81_2146260 [compost metagenome]